MIEDFMMLFFRSAGDKLERNKLLDSAFEEAFIDPWNRFMIQRLKITSEDIVWVKVLVIPLSVVWY